MADTPLNIAPNITLHADSRVFCDGNWTVYQLASLEQKIDQTDWADIPVFVFLGQNINALDSAGAQLLDSLIWRLEKNGQAVYLEGFSEHHHALLQLVKTRMPRHIIESECHQDNFLLRPLILLGQRTQQSVGDIINFLAFFGELCVLGLQLTFRPHRVRWHAVAISLEQSGLFALPIVGLMAFLIGVVLAYQGGAQLQQYGANIFIVEMIGITLLRELAPLLTAIMVAGRTGSAFTAQIGAMKINNELDALNTLGISPMQLLVMPKLIGLMLAMPLLSLFADISGVFGGMLIAALTLDVSMFDFLARFQHTVDVRHFLIGIAKAPIFAACIVVVSCYQGFKVGGSADSLGKHVTRSVVQAIFLVIVLDAFFSIILNWAGF